MKLRRLAQICLALSLVCSLATGAVAEEKGHAEKAAPDMGTKPWTVNIEEITLANDDFRIARWTGGAMQMTLMSIAPGGEIGLEMHAEIDQFIRIEQGKARVLMGKSKAELTFVQEVEDDWAIFVPAGYWHNLVNIGDGELKVYSIYSPPEHAAGTRHKTAADAEHAHHHHH